MKPLKQTLDNPLLSRHRHVMRATKGTFPRQATSKAPFRRESVCGEGDQSHFEKREKKLRLFSTDRKAKMGVRWLPKDTVGNKMCKQVEYVINVKAKEVNKESKKCG